MGFSRGTIKFLDMIPKMILCVHVVSSLSRWHMQKTHEEIFDRVSKTSSCTLFFKKSEMFNAQSIFVISLEKDNPHHQRFLCHHAFEKDVLLHQYLCKFQTRKRFHMSVTMRKVGKYKNKRFCLDFNSWGCISFKSWNKNDRLGHEKLGMRSATMQCPLSQTRR